MEDTWTYIGTGNLRARARIMVERAKEVWFKFIPPWLPVLIALLWIGMQYQKVIDREDSLEKQVMAIQEYMRTEHSEKNDAHARHYIEDNAYDPVR
jgi:hypothetical protein